MSSSEVAASATLGPLPLVDVQGLPRDDKGRACFELVEGGCGFLKIAYIDSQGNRVEGFLPEKVYVELRLPDRTPQEFAAFEGLRRRNRKARERLLNEIDIRHARRHTTAPRIPCGTRSRQSHGSASRVRGGRRRTVVRAGPGDDSGGGSSDGSSDPPRPHHLRLVESGR